MCWRILDVDAVPLLHCFGPNALSIGEAGSAGFQFRPWRRLLAFVSGRVGFLAFPPFSLALGHPRGGEHGTVKIFPRRCCAGHPRLRALLPGLSGGWAGLVDDDRSSLAAAFASSFPSIITPHTHKYKKGHGLGGARLGGEGQGEDYGCDKIRRH